MPIRPIDLQTLLMQMSQVGRDQAVEKDGPILQGAMHALAAQKKEIETKEALHRAEDPPDGAGSVRDRQGRQRKGEGGRREPEGEEAEPPREEIVRDPSLGNKVDLSG